MFMSTKADLIYKTINGLLVIQGLILFVPKAMSQHDVLTNI